MVDTLLFFDEMTWRTRLRENGTFLAMRHGVVAGTATGYRPGPDGDRMLVAMWVVPAQRGTGVAGELVEAVVGWARDDSGERVVLTVMDTNEVARRLFERHGFTLTGQEEPSLRDPVRSEREMERRLEA